MEWCRRTVQLERGSYLLPGTTMLPNERPSLIATTLPPRYLIDTTLGETHNIPLQSAGRD